MCWKNDETKGYLQYLETDRDGKFGMENEKLVFGVILAKALTHRRCGKNIRAVETVSNN